MTKYIAENIFGIANVRIESVADGVRVSGSDNEDDKYTNHHWLNINGQRFDAMDNRDFVFSRWEIHRNKAWRRLSEADIVQGISVNKIPLPAHAP